MLAYPEGEKGKALGISVAAVLSGFSVGLLLGRLLAPYVGCRSMFCLNIPLCVLIATVNAPAQGAAGRRERRALRSHHRIGG
ncbi:MAG TPA: hypothetical protein VEG65_02985 [Candidatus Bathyarchaeia archaeon]|nr:hypothetical protein [Candidatus Bathyarchaeia archaeon]